MIYKQFQDKKISALGMGCMRLPTDESGKIDENKVAEMFDYAIEHGINYFDTAWGYHGGQSEIVVGKTLKRYHRDQFYIADKFPGYDLSNIGVGKTEEIFEKQLQKTGMEYFDFYLVHNVCEANIDGYLNREYGMYEYLLKQKEKGRIRHLGFSGHGNMDTLTRFLDAYGEGMEFGQLQVNYVDWTFQQAEEKMALLKKHNLPVIVMEPVRGGKLATMAPHLEAKLKALRPDERVPGWAFRFLQTLPDVFVTLSGMSNFDQLKENIATYENEKPLTKTEWDTLQSVVQEMLGRMTPCTGCRYCTQYCPMELNIPELLQLYNEHAFTGGGFIAPMRLNAMPENKRPSACLQCRACEAVCPQNIRISEAFADFTSRLQ